MLVTANYLLSSNRDSIFLFHINKRTAHHWTTKATDCGTLVSDNKITALIAILWAQFVRWQLGLLQEQGMKGYAGGDSVMRSCVIYIHQILIIRLFISKTRWWTEHVVFMAQMRNRYKMLERKPEIEVQLGRQKTQNKLENDIKIYFKGIGYQVKSKGEGRPKTGHEGPEGE